MKTCTLYGVTSLAVLIIFFNLISIMITTHLNQIDRTIRDQGAILSYAK